MTLAKVFVTLKDGILDPQGTTIHHALANLGMDVIEDVRMGKVIHLRFGEIDEEQAKQVTEEACKKLLANPVIEDYRIEIVQSAGQKS